MSPRGRRFFVAVLALPLKLEEPDQEERQKDIA